MPLRILLIEDHADFRRLLRHHIQVQWPEARITDYDPMVDAPFREGFDGGGHHVVLLDHQLGRGENGLDLLTRFTSIPGFPPVIMLTGGGDEKLAVQAIKAGAQDYLSKREMNHASLVRVIQDAIDTRGASHRQEQNEQTRKLAQQFQLKLPDYDLKQVLGRGGTAVALLAERRSNGELVVIKVLQQLSDSKSLQEHSARMVQEYELMSRINHPGLARIYHLDFSYPNTCVVMEYFPNGSLMEKIDRGGPLPAAEALDVLAQMARGLAALHEADIIHRDIKPANVMLRADGSVAIIDFGLIKHLSNPMELTQQGQAIGTPLYMSPEQGIADSVSAQSDLYALGITLYAMLTGALPYTAATPLAVLYKHQHAPIPKLPAPHAALQDLLEWLLAKDPAVRPPSARVLLSELEDLSAKPPNVAYQR